MDGGQPLCSHRAEVILSRRTRARLRPYHAHPNHLRRLRDTSGRCGAGVRGRCKNGKGHDFMRDPQRTLRSVMRIRKAAAVIILVASLGSCVCCSLFCCWRWHRVDEFVGGLKCGMSRDDVRRYAENFNGTTVYDPERSNLPDLVVEHGDTHVGCYFSEGRLARVQVSWISKPTKRTMESERNLCKVQPAGTG
jgi:hypothetical protein